MSKTSAEWKAEAARLRAEAADREARFEPGAPGVERMREQAEACERMASKLQEGGKTAQY